MSKIKIWTNQTSVYGSKINTHAGEVKVGDDGFIKVTPEQAESLVDNNLFFDEKQTTTATPKKAAAATPVMNTEGYQEGQAYIFVEGKFSPEAKLDLMKILKKEKLYQLNDDGGLDEIDAAEFTSNENPQAIIVLGDTDLTKAILDHYEDDEMETLLERFGIPQGSAKKPTTLRLLLERKMTAENWKELFAEILLATDEEEGEEEEEEEDAEEDAEDNE